MTPTPRTAPSHALTRGLTPAARLLALVGVLTGVAVAAPPQVEPKELGFDPAWFGAIDGLVEQGLRDGEMAGAVVCVGRTDGIAFLKAYGLRQAEPTPEPMTTDTVFDMASLTKPVATATAVLRLVRDGKLSPDDPVAKHLPEFGRNGKEAITVAQLLTHTGGLIPDNALRDYEDGPEKAWERICDLSPTAEPGSKFIYTDVGFIALGKLVERLSGKPLNEYAAEVTFGPLGMTETGYLPGDDLKRRAAATDRNGGGWFKGEVHDPRAAKLGGVAGHAGLFSTATDMATYATALLRLLRDGKPGAQAPGSASFLNPETAALMATPRDVPNGKRAYGWDVRSGYSSNRGANFSDRAFGHGGFTGTAMWIDPELDLYVIFLSNRLHPDGQGTVNPLAGKVGTVAAEALKDRRAATERGAANVASVSPVLTGIDVLKRDGFAPLRGRKVGLITNHTGRSREGENTAKLLAGAEGVELVALFSPEHGFAGTLDRDGFADATDP
ncbi:MAG TPA: serine hydrolase, partial [Planctomycetaceae bacterium]